MKIDKGVDFPMPAKLNRNYKLDAVLDKMDVGDSIWFPMDEDGYNRGFYDINRAAQTYAKKQDKKFSRRKLLENEQEGIRFWRVK